MINLRSYSEYLAISIEIWLPIKGFEDYYEISTWARIKSKPRLTPQRGWSKGIILSPTTGKVGYKTLTLSVNGIDFRKSVHRLFAEAFFTNPEHKKYVNHKNGIKTDNSFLNIEWSTPSENNKHAIDNKLRIPSAAKGMKNYMSIYTNEQIAEVKRLQKQNIKPLIISQLTGVKQHSLSAIKKGRSWNTIII